MVSKWTSSNKPHSDLVRIFAERSGCGDLDAIRAIRDHVSSLRAALGAPQIGGELGVFLTARGIDGPNLLQDLHCDGYLEPKGRSYHDGFRMVLRAGANQPRTRFTIAHEVCHTFFYELVPELKFSAHQTDPEEERLCNEGAAEMLMPMDHVLKNATGSPESVRSLAAFACGYGVSLDAMLLRLRALKLWNCELSVWHRMTNGRFALDRIRGAKAFNWRWVDESIICRAWEDPKRQPISGRTAVDFQHSDGNEFARFVYFEVKRRGDSVIALWSKRKLRKAEAPLFHKSGALTVRVAPFRSA